MAQTTTNAPGVSDKHRQTIADHVGAMAALELHIAEVLDRQLIAVEDDPVVLAAVSEAVLRSWQHC